MASWLQQQASQAGPGRYAMRASQDIGGEAEEHSRTPPSVRRSGAALRASVLEIPSDMSPGRSERAFRTGNERLYEAYNDLHALAQDFEKPFDAPAILVVGHQTDGKSGARQGRRAFQGLGLCKKRGHAAGGHACRLQSYTGSSVAGLHCSARHPASPSVARRCHSTAAPLRPLSHALLLQLQNTVLMHVSSALVFSGGALAAQRPCGQPHLPLTSPAQLAFPSPPFCPPLACPLPAPPPPAALVEALMGFQFNHVGGGTKTRRPITLHMKYNSACVQPHCYLITDEFGEQEATLEELQVGRRGKGRTRMGARTSAVRHM